MNKRRHNPQVLDERKSHRAEGVTMKYMLLIYDNPDTREQFFGRKGKALGAEINALIAELTASGELAGGEALADPAQTRSIRPKDGAPVVTDGPLAEAKEHFGGYLIVDCETPERATEIASRWPNARFAAMEVRPIMNAGGGQDM
jgi:hypothetical protein